MTSAPQSISELRHALMARRRALAPAEISSAALRARDTFARQTQLRPQSGQVVALYFAHAALGEMDPAPLAEWLESQGVRCVYPRAQGSEIEFAFARAGECEPGPWKVPQPLASAPLCELRAIDWIFVPGVGFSREGARMGMGKGHYDRVLPLLRPRAVRIGVAHAFQLLDSIPVRDWDQPMDWILTPDEFVAGRARLESKQS